jgi:hypothetical protein
MTRTTELKIMAILDTLPISLARGPRGRVGRGKVAKVTITSCS